TMQPGDSLYSVARSHKVLFSELQRVNGITDPRKVKPGFVLKVPGGAAAPSIARNEAPASAPVPSSPPVASASAAPSSSEPQRYGQPTTTQPTVINGERRVAALSDRATDAVSDTQPSAQPEPPKEQVALAAPTAAPAAVAPAVTESGKLRWPASGRIIAGFGGRPDGTHNDGINVSVPLGTEIHAAEDGVVAYAG